MKIGKLIKQKRTELGYSLEQLGQFVGVAKSTVKKWEDGNISNMGRDKIAKLAKMLNVSPLEFIYDDAELVSAYPPSFRLTPHEENLILAYRAKPELQAAVDKLLDIGAEVVNAPSRAGTA